MKLIVVVILTIFTSALAINDQKKTLNKWYEEIEAKIKLVDPADQIHRITSKTNFKCMKTSKLKLDQNGEKVLNFAVAMIAVYGAGFDCLEDGDQKILWRSLLDLFINSYKQTIKSEEIKCFKVELKKFDPQSLLTSGINANAISKYDDFCKSVIDNDGLDNHLRNLESHFRPVADVTCKAVNFVEFKKIFLNIIILSDESAPYDRVRNLLAKIFQDKLKIAYNCVMDRIRRQAVALPAIETSRIDNSDQQSTVQPSKISVTNSPLPISPTVQHQHQQSSSYASSSSHSYSSSGSQTQSQYSAPGFQSQSQSQSSASSWNYFQPNTNSYSYYPQNFHSYGPFYG